MTMSEADSKTEEKRNLWRLLFPVLLFMAISAALFSTINLRHFQNWLAGCNGGLVFVIIAVLPLFGFPVSLLQILAGAKFGILMGFVVSTLAIVVHMFGMYWIGTSCMRRPIEWYLARRKHRLPQVPSGEDRSFAFLMTLLPGSYALKNYVMVIGGTSLRTLLWVCLPVYAVRAIFGIYFGHFSTEPTMFRTFVLIGNTILITVVSAFLVRRLRRRWGMAKDQQQQN
jgi:uncharacterized membrane protein YdjX (TVP38/TMEM64 family)